MSNIVMIHRRFLLHVQLHVFIFPPVPFSGTLFQNARKVILGALVHHVHIHLMEILADLPVIVHNAFVITSMDVKVCVTFKQ